MRLLMHARTPLKAAAIAATAALVLTGCGGNSTSSDSSSTVKPAAKSTKQQLPKTKVEVVSDWTDSPGNPNTQFRIVVIRGNCFVEVQSTSTNAPDALDALEPMRFCSE